MTATTITIDGDQRATLIAALLALLGEETDTLASALSNRDRERRPEPAREAYERVRAVGELLARLGWHAEPARASRVDVERELPIAIGALRRDLQCAQELLADAQTHGNAREVALARAHLRARRDALRRLEGGA